ncbi:MAG: glycosyltransferase [Acidimicrobiales bacterium]|nr:glycosyltransferase [Acidimicrobiales bacterium]
MFPFWDLAIAPVLAAAGARRLVEIGALRGEHTQLIVDHLGPETELHVIDPVPDFDPAEHERRFAGQYVFHRALSVDVLGDLPPMDAALIDGDHNWYTVFNECRLLSEVARAAGKPLPVMILHDVGWPYGYRDLYYDPDTVPAEHRHPWRHAGMRPGRSELVEKGGLSPTMCNAEHEGGPRNGVMSGLEDFIAGYDKPLRTLVIPIYFGLAIVVEEERLEAQPELAAVLDRLESAEGRGELLELAEEVRIKAMLLQHQVYYQREDQQRRIGRLRYRYLETVKGSLLNEHYLENEARLEHLVTRSRDGRPPEARILRDPVRQDQETFRRLQRQRSGAAGPGPGGDSFVPYTAMGRTRLQYIEQALDTIRRDGVGGDLVDSGVGRGGAGIFMRAWLDATDVSSRRLWVVDRFRAAEDGENAPSLPVTGVAGFRADLNVVRDGFSRFGLLDDQVRFLQGNPWSSLADAAIGKVALLRIGPHQGHRDARRVLNRLYDKLAIGGYVIVDDPTGEVGEVVEQFRAERGIEAPTETVDTTAIAWRKDAERPAPPSTGPVTRIKEAVRGRVRGDTSSAAPVPVPERPRVPLAPAVPDGPVDLTVVVVFYDMKREAARTLHSLSRAYQEKLGDLTYEVIAVDNGSSPGQRLTADDVAAFGPEFRLLDLSEEAEPSPVLALNRGIAEGRGENFALMIDGAHVLTPGVLRFGMAGLDTYSPAIVATQQWYTGPGQQGDAMDDGYDQAYEDRLFEGIDWPAAGYRLFEIGHFIGDRDWLDGVWESNCMFVPRSLLEQSGCFDESFSMAGGGYANLELYERLGSSADVTVVTILGEGSFHQVHGGTTTNQPDAVERRARVHGYSRHYAELRGRPFRGPGKPMHYVGSIGSPAARRTRARRLSSAAFAEAAEVGGIDGRPAEPTPVPQELQVAFLDAVWHSVPWAHTTWLGERIESAPTDLLAYQEAIASVRPDHVVVTGGDGGRALFLASVCELVGHGRVIVVDEAPPVPAHPRIDVVDGRADSPDVAARVRDAVGDGRALVVLGRMVDQPTTVREFEAYSSLVPVGSYVVVADTIVNGHPVWTGFGNGPAEAVKQLLTRHGEFVSDPLMEKYSLSFNPGGFLLRSR